MKRYIGYLGALISCAIISTTVGCASGGFQLTRQFARWVNSQQIILRIIIYIVTIPIFGITMLIDSVVFNTMDFWNGRVSQGDFQFQEGEKTFHVQHRFEPATGLRQSTIEVAEAGKHIQTILIRELSSEKIEMLVDGTRRALVNDIQSLPQISQFDANGNLAKDVPFWLAGWNLPVRYLAGK